VALLTDAEQDGGPTNAILGSGQNPDTTIENGSRSIVIVRRESGVDSLPPV
jgi:hypothetical protein